MTSRTLQYALASIFLLLGAWCLIFPGTVVRISFRPELATVTDQARFLMGCFGAQAVLNGTILASARFSPLTFLVFGLVGSVPFFIFNIWFWLVVPVLNAWMLLDLLGNLGILTAGIWGWHLARKEATAAGTS